MTLESHLTSFNGRYELRVSPHTVNKLFKVYFISINKFFFCVCKFWVKLGKINFPFTEKWKNIMNNKLIWYFKNILNKPKFHQISIVFKEFDLRILQIVE